MASGGKVFTFSTKNAYLTKGSSALAPLVYEMVDMDFMDSKIIDDMDEPSFSFCWQPMLI